MSERSDSSNGDDPNGKSGAMSGNGAGGNGVAMHVVVVFEDESGNVGGNGRRIVQLYPVARASITGLDFIDPYRAGTGRGAAIVGGALC